MGSESDVNNDREIFSENDLLDETISDDESKRDIEMIVVRVKEEPELIEKASSG